MRKALLLFAAAAIMATSGCAQKPAQAEERTSNPVPREPQASSSSGSVVRTIPESVHGADILSTISANYKGKVALIDFWATWCGPCRMAMRQIDEIKPALAEKGCAFVYVTGETSPAADWNAMIKKIDGDHYRLTDAQWGELCKSLNIPGIPAYLLLNKDGSRAYDNLSQGGYPGSEVLQNNIEVALTK